MSRTDAHMPWWVATDSKPWRGPRAEKRTTLWTALEFQQWRQGWDGISLHEQSKHWSKSAAVQWYARQENRRERHNTKAALRRENYDAIPFHMTGRHSAIWLAY